MNALLITLQRTCLEPDFNLKKTFRFSLFFLFLVWVRTSQKCFQPIIQSFIPFDVCQKDRIPSIPEMGLVEYVHPQYSTKHSFFQFIGHVLFSAGACSYYWNIHLLQQFGTFRLDNNCRNKLLIFISFFLNNFFGLHRN